MPEAVLPKNRAVCRGALFAVLCLATLFAVFAPPAARAQTYYTPSGNFLTPPMDFETLYQAVIGDADALARFDSIAAPVDSGAGDGSTNAGGQAMIDEIVHGIQNYLGVQWTSAPSPTPAREQINYAVIDDITNANPAVVTYTGDDVFVEGQSIMLDNIGGMTELNSSTTYYTITNLNAGAKTFELLSVDSTGFGTYTSGGSITTPVAMLLYRASIGEMDAIYMLRNIFVARHFFPASGYQPGTPLPALPPMPMVAVPNVGVQALAFLMGGTGTLALRTLQLAAQCSYGTTTGSSAPRNISSITDANPAVFTVPGISSDPDFANDATVRINDTGMTAVDDGGTPADPSDDHTIELDNGIYYVQNISSDSFQLRDSGGNAVDTTLLPAYGGGGTMIIITAGAGSTVGCPSLQASNAQAIVSQIFSYCGQNTEGTGLILAGSTCTQDRSGGLLQMLPTTLQTYFQAVPNTTLCPPDPDPTSGRPCTPNLDLIFQTAIDGDEDIRQLLSNSIGQYLVGMDPCPPAFADYPELCMGAGDEDNLNDYIGPAAVAWLNSMFTTDPYGDLHGTGILPAPIPPSEGGTTPPVDPPDDSIREILGTLPIPGGGVHMIPSPGANTAPQPCSGYMDDPRGPDYIRKDIRLQDLDGGDSFGTNPCIFTRERYNLNFAQQFQAGQQWSAFIPAWVQQQWMPALRAMAAQWTAALTSQGAMMGMTFDAGATTQTITTIQAAEAEARDSVAPSQQAAVSGSAAQGTASASSGVGGMTNAFRNLLEVHAGTGGAPP